MRNHITLALAAVSMLALAACGDSGSSKSESTPPVETTAPAAEAPKPAEPAATAPAPAEPAATAPAPAEPAAPAPATDTNTMAPANNTMAPANPAATQQMIDQLKAQAATMTPEQKTQAVSMARQQAEAAAKAAGGDDAAAKAAGDQAETTVKQALGL